MTDISACLLARVSSVRCGCNTKRCRQVQVQAPMQKLRAIRTCRSAYWLDVGEQSRRRWE